MARKKIREYDGKRLLIAALNRLGGWKLALRTVQIASDSAEPISAKDLGEKHPWMLETPLVAKPDMLFGKRGKNNLVLLNANLNQVVEFVKDRMGNEVRRNTNNI